MFQLRTWHLEQRIVSVFLQFTLACEICKGRIRQLWWITLPYNCFFFFSGRKETNWVVYIRMLQHAPRDLHRLIRERTSTEGLSQQHRHKTSTSLQTTRIHSYSFEFSVFSKCWNTRPFFLTGKISRACCWSLFDKNVYLKGSAFTIAFLVSNNVFVAASFMTSQLFSNIYCLYSIMAKYICFHGKIKLSDYRIGGNKQRMKLFVCSVACGNLDFWDFEEGQLWISDKKV